MIEDNAKATGHVTIE